MKYIYNNELQIIDTEDKAYLLGLFYSDGYVCYNPLKIRYFSGVTLIYSDRELLEKIVEKFPFFYIEDGVNKSTIRCNQRKFCEDIINNGVLPNKSGINKNNLRFPNIESKFYKDFIRGYFDGDGSICFNKNNGVNCKRFSIVSNNYMLIKRIKEVLHYNNIKTSFSKRRGGKSFIRGKEVIFNGLCFEISTMNTLIIKNIGKYFKTDYLTLTRKSNILYHWVDVPIKVFPPCPRCGSTKTKLQSSKLNSIYCNKCNRISTVGKSYKKFDKNLLFCNHCFSKNIVNNGDVKSRTDKKIIGFKLLCKDCNKCSSKKLTAPS